MKKNYNPFIVSSILTAVGIAVLILVNSCKQEASVLSPETDALSQNRRPVVLSEIRQMRFEDHVDVSGSVEAKNTAIVSARIPGVLDKIFVEEGDAVTAGKTRLFQTDKIKVVKALEAARQQLLVAEANADARRATLARIEADLEKASTDYHRFKRLYENDNAVTQNALEIQELQFTRAQAAQKEASAALALAEAQQSQSRSSLAIAEKDMADSLAISPITGNVSARMLEPGEMAGAGTPVMKVDDLSLVEISAFLPEAYYARVIPHQTRLRARIQGKDLDGLVITYKSPIIHSKLRTFEIKGLIEHPPAGVVPGAMARLSVLLDTRTGMGVPLESVLKRSGGQVIFTVENGTAKQLEVKTGLTTNGYIEIMGDTLREHMPVVRMGQEDLDNDSAVSVVEEGGAR